MDIKQLEEMYKRTSEEIFVMSDKGVITLDEYFKMAPFPIKEEKCIHKVIKLDPITGDPFNPKFLCVKCGEKAEINLITMEIR